MKKTIYHGSKLVIRKPIYGYGKKNNDYGLGFYCTENNGLACEWAVTKNRDGIINEYEIDLDGLKVLNLNDGKHSILNWITILIQNRVLYEASVSLSYGREFLIKNHSIDLKGVDVIIGYRADDSYFSFAQAFLNGQIGLKRLDKAMHLGDLGEQVVLISKKSFAKINYIDSSIAKREDWYESKIKRLAKAKDDYLKLLQDRSIKGDIYLHDIIDKEIKPNDPRLR